MNRKLYQKRDEAITSLLAIEENWDNLVDLKLGELDPKQTAIVFVDMVEGFVNVGALSSNRALDIIKPVQRLNEATKGWHKIYFRDCHPKNCAEFKAYVPHCIEGTIETELIKELVPDDHENSVEIFKNCTNGFMAEGFQVWLAQHPEITNFIITGLVTDICVMTFALTLKTYFNEKNIDSRLMVPINTVETFELDLTNHQAELMNTFALYNMQMNGIELYRDFE